MGIINVKGLKHKYNIKDRDGNIAGEKWAVNGVTMDIAAGSFVAVLGKNGSGKSTFAKHLNALLVPDGGTVLINSEGVSYNTSDEKVTIPVRRQIGMIFQNPDNQMVGNTPREDIGFGLENLALPYEEIWKRIDDIVDKFGIGEFADRNSAHLSGGQKQRLAIASVMAMQPKCMVCDEATSMLDPANTAEIIRLIKEINRDYHITIIMITHRIEEIVDADYIYVMDCGRVAMKGKPMDILTRPKEMEKLGLESTVPFTLLDFLGIVTEKNREGNFCGTSIEATVEAVKRKGLTKKAEAWLAGGDETEAEVWGDIRSCCAGEKIISGKQVSFSYKESGETIAALDNISFDIRKGEFVAVAGETGSGKSTLLQLFNGLLRPSCGELIVAGYDVGKVKNLKELRKHIGFVFQYPEYQLFEITVMKDVMYGPQNFGMTKDAAEKAAVEAVKLVGLEEEYLEYAPFDLSGGQKKKVALAGILAYHPDILILDEPVAGLDPLAKRNLFSLLKQLNREENVTIIFVSHDMKDIYDMADRLMVLKAGRLIYDGDISIFEDSAKAEMLGLAIPDKAKIKAGLQSMTGA